MSKPFIDIDGLVFTRFSQGERFQAARPRRVAVIFLAFAT